MTLSKAEQSKHHEITALAAGKLLKALYDPTRGYFTSFQLARYFSEAKLPDSTTSNFRNIYLPLLTGPNERTNAVRHENTFITPAQAALFASLTPRTISVNGQTTTAYINTAVTTVPEAEAVAQTAFEQHLQTLAEERLRVAESAKTKIALPVLSNEEIQAIMSTRTEIAALAQPNRARFLVAALAGYIVFSRYTEQQVIEKKVPMEDYIQWQQDAASARRNNSDVPPQPQQTIVLRRNTDTGPYAFATPEQITERLGSTHIADTIEETRYLGNVRDIKDGGGILFILDGRDLVMNYTEGALSTDIPQIRLHNSRKLFGSDNQPTMRYLIALSGLTENTIHAVAAEIAGRRLQKLSANEQAVLLKNPTLINEEERRINTMKQRAEPFDKNKGVVIIKGDGTRVLPIGIKEKGSDTQNTTQATASDGVSKRAKNENHTAEHPKAIEQKGSRRTAKSQKKRDESAGTENQTVTGTDVSLDPATSANAKSALALGEPATFGFPQAEVAIEQAIRAEEETKRYRIIISLHPQDLQGREEDRFAFVSSSLPSTAQQITLTDLPIASLFSDSVRIPALQHELSLYEPFIMRVLQHGLTSSDVTEVLLPRIRGLFVAEANNLLPKYRDLAGEIMKRLQLQPAFASDTGMNAIVYVPRNDLSNMHVSLSNMLSDPTMHVERFHEPLFERQSIFALMNNEWVNRYAYLPEAAYQTAIQQQSGKNPVAKFVLELISSPKHLALFMREEPISDPAFQKYSKTDVDNFLTEIIYDRESVMQLFFYQMLGECFGTKIQQMRAPDLQRGLHTLLFSLSEEEILFPFLLEPISFEEANKATEGLKKKYDQARKMPNASNRYKEMGKITVMQNEIAATATNPWIRMGTDITTQFRTFVLSKLPPTRLLPVHFRGEHSLAFITAVKAYEALAEKARKNPPDPKNFPGWYVNPEYKKQHYAYAAAQLAYKRSKKPEVSDFEGEEMAPAYKRDRVLYALREELNKK